jgi:hypothetical protein
LFLTIAIGYLVGDQHQGLRSASGRCCSWRSPWAGSPKSVPAPMVGTIGLRCSSMP